MFEFLPKEKILEIIKNYISNDSDKYQKDLTDMLERLICWVIIQQVVKLLLQSGIINPYINISTIDNKEIRDLANKIIKKGKIDYLPKIINTLDSLTESKYIINLKKLQPNLILLNSFGTGKTCAALAISKKFKLLQPPG